MTASSEQRAVSSKRTGEKRMTRNIFAFICLLLTILLLTGLPAQAQQPKKVPRIGYLSSVDASSESTRAEAIRLALRELGYIEGQNIASEYRYAEGKADRYPELAAELARLKVAIIVASRGAGQSRAAKNDTKMSPSTIESHAA